MEFTYEGFVRHGFGFYNPNHAAAFICALMPFFWLLLLNPRIFFRILGGVASIALIVCLALTYSRTGAFVFFAEVVIFAFYFKKTYRKIIIGLGLAFIMVIVFISGYGRFVVDASIINRFDIWFSGISLFASNPAGVGLGNSGEIVSAYMLPDGVNCRTMVNTFLTILCEMGLILGYVFFTFILYVLLNSPKKQTSLLVFAAYISFFGLIISSCFSTVLDLDVLLHPIKYQYLSCLNIIFYWLAFLIFLALFIFLLARDFSKRRMISSGVLSLAGLLTVLLIGNLYKEAPKAKNIFGDIFLTYSSMPSRNVVLYDDSYTLKSALKTLKKYDIDAYHDVHIALKSWQKHKELPKINPHKFLLMGCCSDFANQSKHSICILINPSPFFSPKYRNVIEAYFPKWDPKYENIKQQFANMHILVKEK